MRVFQAVLGRLGLVLALVWLGGGWAAAVEAGPYLRVETGVHEGAINAMAVLPGSSDFITVSDDKTARIWSLGSLAPRGVIRPPLGSGDNGALYAVAASEKVIALAGRLEDEAGRFGLALYMRADLSAGGVLSGFPAAITALRFSRSGRKLAIGMQGGAGIRVLDLAGHRTLYRQGNFTGTVNGLDFDADDRLAVASDDGALRIFDADGNGLKLPPMPKGAVPWRLAFAPDGHQLAIGDRRQAAVHILDMRTLRFGADLNGGPITAGAFETVAYSADGKVLFAGGSYVDRTGQVHIRRFVLGLRPSAADIPASRQLVTDMLPLDGGLIIITADPAIVRLDPGGGVAAMVRTSHADFHAGGAQPMLVSQDGGVVDLPDGQGLRVRFDAAEHAIVAADGRPMLPPYASVRGFGVTEWLNSHTPRLNGHVLVLEPAETARSAAVLPDGSAVAIGTDFFLRLTGRVGELWRQPTEAPVWSVNASGDGRVIVAALGDGTIHWYDAGTGHERLALLLDPATRRFVAWTPGGFFDHDHRSDGLPDGRGLIGYGVNAASGWESRFVEIGQLYPLFFRPDLVGLSLRGDAASREIVDRQSALLGSVAAALAGGLPARVTLLEACPLLADGCAGAIDLGRLGGRDPVAVRTGAAQVRIRYRLDDATEVPGPATITRDGAVLAPQPTILAQDARSRVEEVVIGLAAGANRIQLTPVSRNRAVEASAAAVASLVIDRAAASLPSMASGGRAREGGGGEGRTMYVLSVGVGEFVEERLDILALRNAGADAEAVADLFAAPSPLVYQTPKVTRLIGKQATREAIVAALSDIAARATPDDEVVIFFAGHGLSIGGRYFYAAGDLGQGEASAIGKLLHPPTDADHDAALAALYQSRGLSQATLLGLLQSIAASRVAVILDTCYSATAATSDAVLRRDLNTTVTNRLGHASGRFVLSSAFREAHDSGGDEMPDHGLFTAHLLQAFEGAADIGNSGMIDIYKLATYMHRSVLTQSTRQARQMKQDTLVQEPSFYFAGNDFFELRAVQAPGGVVMP